MSNNDSISPDLQFSILCDDVRREANGKFIIIGTYEHIYFNAEFPVKMPAFCIHNRWCCGSGNFTQMTQIKASDGTTTIAVGKPIKITLKNDCDTASTVEYFNHIPIPSPGTYWVEILLDKELRLRYAFTVHKVKKPENN